MRQCGSIVLHYRFFFHQSIQHLNGFGKLIARYESVFAFGKCVERCFFFYQLLVLQCFSIKAVIAGQVPVPVIVHNAFVLRIGGKKQATNRKKSQGCLHKKFVTLTDLKIQLIQRNSSIHCNYFTFKTTKLFTMPANLSQRIKSIQQQLSVPQSGVFDITTANALCSVMKINGGTSLTTKTKAIQRGVGVTDDGIIGPITVSRIEALLQPKLPAIPAGASMAVSIASLQLIINAEVSSKEAYTAKYQSPVWPGGDSGVTIGIGFDIGYCSRQDFMNAWSAHLSQQHLDMLLNVLGKKGAACKQIIPSLKVIKVSYDTAVQVFYQHTLPACARDVRRIYPGVQKLPPDTQGALLSLLYNRGPLINDSDRRKEMKALIPLVAAGDIKGVAAQLRSMKRLWTEIKQNGVIIQKGMKGLIIRREQEAVLAENGSFNILPENIVTV
ncbi:hypothetical protein CAP35_06335 [Chitinophagaceae bacterium IBVUCB1]|nr:hypothetical protein CAP35_06335 [Chitinophagaceae bacterium IBVUCB1]